MVLNILSMVQNAACLGWAILAITSIKQMIHTCTNREFVVNPCPMSTNQEHADSEWEDITDLCRKIAKELKETEKVKPMIATADFNLYESMSAAEVSTLSAFLAIR